MVNQGLKMASGESLIELLGALLGLSHIPLKIELLGMFKCFGTGAW